MDQTILCQALERNSFEKLLIKPNLKKTLRSLNFERNELRGTSALDVVGVFADFNGTIRIDPTLEQFTISPIEPSIRLDKIRQRGQGGVASTGPSTRPRRRLPSYRQRPGCHSFFHPC